MQTGQGNRQKVATTHSISHGITHKDERYHSMCSIPFLLNVHAKFNRTAPRSLNMSWLCTIVRTALSAHWPKCTMVMLIHTVYTQWAKRETSHPACGDAGVLWRDAIEAAAPWTYRASRGTPPASGSGFLGRTWPLRTPATRWAATWAASWLWAAPSNHPERELVSPLLREGDTVNTHTATTVITKRLSVWAWPSLPVLLWISPSVQILSLPQMRCVHARLVYFIKSVPNSGAS